MHIKSDLLEEKNMNSYIEYGIMWLDDCSGDIYCQANPTVNYDFYIWNRSDVPYFLHY